MTKYLQISILVPYSPFYLFNVSFFVLRVIFWSNRYVSGAKYSNVELTVATNNLHSLLLITFSFCLSDNTLL